MSYSTSRLLNTLTKRPLRATILLSSLFLNISTTASEISFDEDPSLILKKLQAQKPAPRFRSLPLIPTEIKPTKTRALKRLTAIPGTVNQSFEEEVQVKIRDESERVKLHIEFANGSAELSPSSYSKLDLLASVLIDESISLLPIHVGGHTDDVGSEEKNLQLSLQRALAVRSYLIRRGGLPEERIDVAGYGEGDPIASNDNDQERKLNRRVEVSVFD